MTLLDILFIVAYSLIVYTAGMFVGYFMLHRKRSIGKYRVSPEEAMQNIEKILEKF